MNQSLEAADSRGQSRNMLGLRVASWKLSRCHMVQSNASTTCEAWHSRNLLILMKLLATQSTTPNISALWSLVSVSRLSSALLSARPRKPRTGSMWWANRIQRKLHRSCRSVVDPEFWVSVPDNLDTWVSILTLGTFLHWLKLLEV